MFFPIRLILAIAFGGIGALLLLAASNNWKWMFRLVMGKERLRKQGENTTKTIFYVVGGLGVLIGLMILF